MHHTIFLAGAAGAIGRRLVPLLVRNGHTVFGTTRSRDRAAQLEAAGVRPVIVDVFDADALKRAVRDAAPTVIIHQLTDLAGGMDADPEAARRANARLRREGTANLVNAAVAAGTKRMVAQSIAWAYAAGSPPYSEEHSLDLGAEGARGTTIVDGVVPLERAVLDTPGIEGIVLRYGQLYGPGTWTETPDGASPLHVDAAAYAALLAIDHGAPGIYNVADHGSEVTSDKAIAALTWTPDFRLASTDQERPRMFDVREDDLSGEETRRLLALHLAGMHADSPPGSVYALDLSGLMTPEVTVWTAWHDDRVAAVGALKMLPDGSAEVKSMRTHPDFLRKGAGAAILERIIASASTCGVRRLSLETGSGPAFEPAVALYRLYGFKDGPAFSHYAAGGFSRFFHLDLG